MAAGVGLLFELLAKDNASPAFLRVAAAADKAATATGRAQARIASAGARMSAVGASMTRKLSLPLLAVGAASVKAASDFNASMTRIQTQAGASAADVRALSKQVLAMKNIQQGPNDLARALYHLKSVGLDNVGAMKALRTASDLAAVGGANLEDTTNALAGAWRTGIKGAQDFHEAAATVNAVIGAGNMTLGDFTEALSTGILPSAKTFGLTLKDVGSALALFTDESVPANVAATRLRMSFSLLAAPSGAAEKQLNQIGLTGFRLGQDMRKPDGLIVAIGDLKQHLDDAGLHGTAAAQLLSHAFGGGRSSSAILGMINNFDVLKQKQEQVTRSLTKYDEAVRTQQATPEAQFKVALANLEKAGVLLGTQLLPIATDVAHVITDIASGFNSLSSGQKRFAVEAGVVLLILGPMLSLVGKLAKGIAVMWAAGAGVGRFTAGMRAATLSTEAMTSKAYLAGRALRGLSKGAAAFAGAGIGYAMGKMAQDASKADKAVATLGGTLSGAAVGFMVGGPIGAAIGGLTGLLGGLAGAFGGDHGAAARAAELQANVESLTGTLEEDGGAVRGLTRDWLAHQLAADGVVALLPKLGVSLDTATRAALGNKAAIAEVTAAAKSHGSAMSGEGAAAQYVAGKILGLGTALNEAKAATLDDAKAATAMYAAHHKVAPQVQRSADAVSMMAAGSKDATAAMHVEAASAANLGASLKELTKQYLKTTNAALGIAQSELGFLDSLHSMKQALDDSKGSLAQHTAAGRAAQEALLGAAQGALAMDDGTRKGNRSLLEHITNLRNAAVAAGADRGAVHDLLGSLNLLPSQINMRLNIDTGASMTKLREIQTQINNMHGKTLFVGVSGGHTLGVASGGPVRGPGSSTSDSIPARLSDGEYVVRASQARKHRSLLDSINYGGRGFKDGGPITTGTSDGHKVWIYGGIRYSSLSAAQNARTRASQATQDRSYRLTGAPGVGSTTYDTLHKAQNALAKVVASLGKVFGRMAKHDLPAMAKALGKTGSDVKAAFSGWLEDAKKLGIDKSTRRDLAGQAQHVAHLVNVRDAAQAQLHTLIQNRAAEKSTVATAGRGIFDITSAGTNPSGTGVSFGALNAQALQDKRIVAKWAAGIRKLGQEGFGNSPTGRNMLRQLAEAGPSDYPQVQALLAATPKQLAGLIGTERAISQTSAGLGGYIGGELFGDKIKHQRAEVARDIAADRAAYRALIQDMRRFMAHPVEVDITLDGRKVASGVATGGKRNARRK